MLNNAAIVFTILTGVIALYQLFLALGMPWGAASMGGRFPGKYPPKMRIVALVNVFVLLFFAMVVLAEANMFFRFLKPVSGIGIWFIAAFYFLTTILNAISPAKIERIWVPVAFIQLISVIMVALGFK
ncbi:MAG: hypothetical protein PHX54_01830 [Lentimicrobiaceae bacterium]|nr:hypothetical protein [Lentimicrobiaceae bacterium]